MAKISTEMGNFTPLFDAVIQAVGVVGASVYGRVWRYCQGERGVCQATMDTIADELCMSRHTVLRWLKKLSEAGYLEDSTPDLRNRPHTYRDTGKVRIQIRLDAVTESNSTAPGVAESNTGVAESNTGVAESNARCSRKSHEERKKREEKREEKRETVAAVAPSPDPDLDDIEWNDGQSQHEKPSVLKDPRASDPITLGQACAERQEEEAAKGRPLGWTVPGGAESIPDAMVAAWVTAKGLVPEQIPKELVDQYRRAMASAIKGLSATEDQAAQAVRHVLTHPDYAWYSYNHPKVEKFKQDVQSVILQILSGRFKANADGKLVEDVPLEELAQGTGYAAIMAYRELEERKMREAGEEVPKGLFDH